MHDAKIQTDKIGPMRRYHAFNLIQEINLVRTHLGARVLLEQEAGVCRNPSDTAAGRQRVFIPVIELAVVEQERRPGAGGAVIPGELKLLQPQVFLQQGWTLQGIIILDHVDGSDRRIIRSTLSVI